MTLILKQVNKPESHVKYYRTRVLVDSAIYRYYLKKMDLASIKQSSIVLIRKLLLMKLSIRMTCMITHSNTCLCPRIPTTEESFKRSELVTIRQIIGMDPITK
jgi:hypothetical protein